MKVKQDDVGIGLEWGWLWFLAKRWWCCCWEEEWWGEEVEGVCKRSTYTHRDTSRRMRWKVDTISTQTQLATEVEGESNGQRLARAANVWIERKSMRSLNFSKREFSFSLGPAGDDSVATRASQLTHVPSCSNRIRCCQRFAPVSDDSRRTARDQSRGCNVGFHLTFVDILSTRNVWRCCDFPSRTSAGQQQWRDRRAKHVYLEDGDCLIEMMTLHGRGGIDRGERRGTFHHESIGFPSMVEIVTKTSDEQGDTLSTAKVREKSLGDSQTDRGYLIRTELMFGLLDHRVDCVSNTEGMGPVMIRDISVILSHS